ncbi:juvenile hormone epoxide hydrolase 2 isoform X2 [Halyomorpha halys]|uniref:juvenile hormone epoxide hydrolase 2 isoform X2 n=1 Tax=Halyomorpha halys TaxID=286706 RepID=UPI0006D4D510|nr:juvenile hormone epoxide hydrolase 2-like isoform X2 [Halyomorpha halys]
MLSCYIYSFTILPPLPQLHLKYWGPGNEKPDDQSIRPFRIRFPESDIIQLKNRLNSTRSLSHPLENSNFQYGFNTYYMNDLLDFWITEYNWTEREAYLNKFPQYITEIGGLDLHFVHVKPNPSQVKGKEVLPLLLIHGWPSIPSEFFHLIPLLTTPHPNVDFLFEVIIPSLPGFGFSKSPSKKGLNAAEMGLILDELMERLSFESYHIHTEDIGSAIGMALSILRPDRVRGFHSTLCVPFTLKSMFYTVLSTLFPRIFVEEPRREMFAKQWSFWIEETGYLHMQSTKPDTVGVALTDSPAGFAAYTLEKVLTGENKQAKFLPDGGLKDLNKLEVLDNIMVLWLTKTVTSSLRIYAENFNSGYFIGLGIYQYPINVPSACVWFKDEIAYFPQIAVEASFSNLLSFNLYPKGGHFAALNEPKLLSDDIWNFIKILRRKTDQRICLRSNITSHG